MKEDPGDHCSAATVVTTSIGTRCNEDDFGGCLATGLHIGIKSQTLKHLKQRLSAFPPSQADGGHIQLICSVWVALIFITPTQRRQSMSPLLMVSACDQKSSMLSTVGSRLKPIAARPTKYIRFFLNGSSVSEFLVLKHYCLSLQTDDSFFTGRRNWFDFRHRNRVLLHDICPLDSLLSIVSTSVTILTGGFRSYNIFYQQMAYMFTDCEPARTSNIWSSRLCLDIANTSSIYTILGPIFRSLIQKICLHIANPPCIYTILGRLVVNVYWQQLDS
jgi:hypothetical protein